MGLDVPKGRTVRRAEVADAEDLVRLRAQMLADMGRSVGDDADPWRAKAKEWFSDRLVRGREFASFVVDDPDAGVVACSAGIRDFHAPGPGNLAGVRGHVFNMSTLPAHRRRGYARACLETLLDWFRDETEARVINLNATPDGIALYRSVGFTQPRFSAFSSYSPSRGASQAPASGRHRRSYQHECMNDALTRLAERLADILERRRVPQERCGGDRVRDRLAAGDVLGQRLGDPVPARNTRAPSRANVSRLAPHIPRRCRAAPAVRAVRVERGGP